MEDGKYQYQKEWEEYKRKQITFWLVILCYIPFMFLFAGIFGGLFGNVASSQNISFVAFVIYAAIWVILGLRLQYWKCPQCGKWFHTKWWWNNILSSKCLHCKLPKYKGSSFYYEGFWNVNR